MRKVKKNRLLALLLMGLLLFSNYGIMAYADEIPALEMGSQDEAGKDAEGQDAAGQDAEGQDAAGQDAEGQDATEQDAAGQDAEGQDAEGQDATEQDAAGQELAGQELPQTIEVPAKIEVVEPPQDVDENGNEIINKYVEYDNDGKKGETVEKNPLNPFDKKYVTEVFYLTNTNDEYDKVNAYCNDIDTEIKENSKYLVKELPQDNEKSKSNSESLRGIVINGYDQNIGLTSYQKELKDKALGFLSEEQIDRLSEKDVIAATQIAIWKLENPKKELYDFDPQFSFDWEDKGVTNLAKYLSMQKESDPSKNNLKIEARATDENTAVKLENGEVSVNYTYSILNRVNEQVETFLEVFVNGNKLADDAYSVVDLGNGNKSLSFKNAIEDTTKNAEIEAKIVIKGTYAVEDVYDLVPTKANKNTQRLVSTPMLMSYNLPTLKQMFKIEYTAPKVELVDTGEGDSGEGDSGEGDSGEGEPGEGEPGEGEPGEGDPGEGDPGEDEPVTPGGGGGATNPPVVEPQPEPTNPTPQPTTPVAQNDNDNDDDDEDIEDEATPLAAPQIIPVASPVATIASAEPTEEIIDEETPLSAPPVIETEEEIIEEVPLAAPELPKTGGFAPELLYALGASLIATGLKIRKK